jgi:hypothetical protein
MTMNSKSIKAKADAKAKEIKSNESDQEESDQEESAQEESDQEESDQEESEQEESAQEESEKESKSSDSEDKPKLKLSKSTKSITKQSISILIDLIKNTEDLADDDILNPLIDLIKNHFKPCLEKIVTDENSLPKKAKKDPKAPKKGRSSYILFCSDNRASVKEEFPDYNPSQIVSELGSKWKKSSEETKKNYTKKAKKDKERYIKEFEDYTPSEGFEKPEVKAPKKDPKSPKRGTTAYIYFCKDKRPKLKDANPEMKGKEITTELSSMWKNISDRKRVKYTDLATEDKKRYTDELKEYVPSDGFEKPITKAKSNTIKTSKSAFHFFSLKKKESIKEGMKEGSSSKEVTAEVGRIWKEKYKGNEKKSKRYIKAAEKDKKRYIKESAEFIKNSEDEEDEEDEEEQ